MVISVLIIFLSCFILSSRTISEMRIFEAEPSNRFHQHRCSFSGFLGMEILLEWKTKEF